MLRLRREEDRDEYRCCCCFHVTTGTILLGLWHLVVQLTVIILCFVMVMHPELELPVGLGSSSKQVATTTETPVFKEARVFDSIMALYMDNNDAGNSVKEGAKDDVKKAWNDLGLKFGHHEIKKPKKEDRAVGVLVTSCSLAITIMLIYGTARGRPGYIMPFFCLQAFDFCISCLTAVGYLSYMPDIKTWLKNQPDVPYKASLMSLPPQTLDCLAVGFFFFVVFAKAYFLGVVWSTYKYLASKLSPTEASNDLLASLYYPMLTTSVSSAAQSHNSRSSSSSRTYIVDEPESEDQMEQGAPLLPPKYEDAIKAPKEEESLSSVPPPPPYTPFAPGLF